MSNLLTVSKIKALVKEQELQTSKEFLDALSEEVAALVLEAAAKAKVGNRKTVKARDLTTATAPVATYSETTEESNTF